MEQRKIGSLSVPVVGVGCNNFGRKLDQQATTEVVSAALDEGAGFFDTADAYNNTLSEAFLGEALGPQRSSAVIATKFGKEAGIAGWGGHPDYIERAVNESLRRLQTDWIDLYQMHAPDPSVPIEDTLGALDALVTAGKVREIGCSNFDAAQLRHAEHAAGGRARFVSVQNRYSLLHREPETEVLPACAELGIGFLPFWPLHNGILTGKYQTDAPLPPDSRLSALEPERRDAILDSTDFALVHQLEQLAADLDHSLLDLAMSWLLSRDTLSSIIAGVTSVQQVRANVAAASWRLSASELGEIDQLLNKSK